MLALHMYRESLCPVCGGPSDECQSAETLDEARYGRFAVEYGVCLRTRELRRAMAEVSDSADEPSALVFTTRRREL